jgi:TonB-linked SusC/RagA family outer membrane protein
MVNFSINQNNQLKKIFSVMKYAILFMFISILSITAGSYAQQAKVSVNIQNGSIYDVVSEIEKQTDFMFFYKSDDISNNLRVSVRASKHTVPEVLDEVMKDTDLSYNINNKVILIAKKTNLSLQQTTRKITGLVVDEKGEHLAGVSIREKGTANGTSTDVEGKFSLSVASGAVLQISYIGYADQEIVTDDRTTIDVILKEDALGLDEVVVVGYGKQKKTSLTAAVGSVKGEDLVSTPASNISNMLAGRMAGLVTAQTSGAVGSDETAIRIRGISTNGSTTPLVVIDGIPRDMAFFNQLNSNAISSVNVLKDAAAVAPYGMAGANGVILVTTKNGEKGKSQLSYSGYMGFSRPTVLAKTLNSYEFVLMYNEAMKNQTPNGKPPYSAEDIAGFKASVEGAPDADYDKYPSSDAGAYLFGNNAPKYNHNLSLSGGTELFNYYLGLGYTHQEGHWKTVYQNRYTLDLSLVAKPTKTTSVGFKMNGLNQKFHEPRIDEMTVHKRVFSYLPIDAITYSNGLPANNRKNNLDAMMADDEYVEIDQLKIFTQLFVEQDLSFIKGLKFKGVVSFDPSNIFKKDWRQPYPTFYTINTSVTPYEYVPTVDPTKPSLYENLDMYRNYTWQGILSYNNVFGNHSIDALAVYEGRKTHWNGVGVSRTNYEVNIDEISLGSPVQQNWGASGSSSETTQLGYVTNINYGFKGKYLLSLAGRYDGSYYFAPGKKFGFFPSAAMGWRISEESFMKQYDWIDNFKIRGSWGTSGALAGEPFQYSSGMTVYGNAYVFNGSVYQGVNERLEPNVNITWEKATKIDVGFDLSLWKNKFGLEFDCFYEKRNNMLASPNVEVPIEYGIGLAQENAGVMNNRGVEFSATGMNRFKNGLYLDLRFNMTYAKNELIETFESAATRNDPNRSRTGRPLGTPFGYLAERLFQESDFNPDGSLKEGIPDHTFSKVAPGDIKWVDVNKDGKIDGADETALGYPVLPQIVYGFSSRLAYKNLDLEVLFQGAAQSNLFLFKGMSAPFNNGDNAPRAVLDYWTPENTNAKYPRPWGQGGNNNNNAGSTENYNSWFMRSGAYLRVKNITLGYTLPKPWTNTLGIESVRFYASGFNLLTFSDVKGLIDPEMDNSGAKNNNMRGWYSPHQKTLAFGLNIDF